MHYNSAIFLIWLYVDPLPTINIVDYISIVYTKLYTKYLVDLKKSVIFASETKHF